MSLDRKNTFIGKHLLFGITYLNDNESVESQIQSHGTITEITEFIIRVKLYKTDEYFDLPSDLDALKEAKPGEYKLRQTGEIVKDPDLISSWTVRK